MGAPRAIAVALAALMLACGGLAILAMSPTPLTSAAQAHPEPGYDDDGDTIPNTIDNCFSVPNGAQTDTDGDGAGDSCDADDDGDLVPDTADNCRVVPNPGQEDENSDGRGDACPPVDDDGDGVFNEDDNCLQVPNPDQFNLTGDAQGDACDRDDDDDRYDDGFDNCPLVWNPDQTDADRDGIGGACDASELIAGPAGGGASRQGGAGTPGTAGRAGDRTAPRLTVSVVRRQRLADAGRALVVSARCSEACDLKADVRTTARAARRAGLRRAGLVLARGSWSLAAAGRTYVFVRWTAAARGLRAGRRLTATLKVTATDGGGNRRTVNRVIDLRR